MTDRAAKIVGDTMALVARSAFTKAISVPTFFVAANVLGPSGLGLLRLIETVPSLAKYANPDYCGVALRNVRDLVAEDGKLAPDPVRNVGFTMTLLSALVIAVAVAVTGFLSFEDPVVRYGVCLSAVTLFATACTQVLGTNSKLLKRFKALAFGQSLGDLAQCAIVLAGVWTLGIFANLTGALVGLIVLSIYLWHRIGLHFRFSLDPQELKRQTVLVVPLTLAAMAFGLSQLGQRGIVGGFWGVEMLGYFVAAVAFAEYGMMLTNLVLQSAAVHIYEQFHVDAKARQTASLVAVPTLLLSYATPPLFAFLSVAGQTPMGWLLPEYGSILPHVDAIWLDAWLLALPTFFLTAMTSQGLNQMWSGLVVRLGSFGVFIVGAAVTYTQNLELAGLLWTRVIADVAMVAMVAFLTAGRLYSSPAAALRAWGLLLLPGIWLIGLAALKHWGMVPQSLTGQLLVYAGWLLTYAPLFWLLDRQVGIVDYIRRRRNA